MSRFLGGFSCGRIYFGSHTDEPVPGDYNGNGSREVGILRPSSGLWVTRGVSRVYFGSSGDFNMPGDYDGDGTDEIGIFRFSTGLWTIRSLSRLYFGNTGDIPVTR